jgi:PIN domain nuclease of toxin-antitoxin system
VLTIEPAHLAALAQLPMHHRDPFDHLLIAQAIVEKAVLLSEDRHTLRYPVRYVTCSQLPLIQPCNGS